MKKILKIFILLTILAVGGFLYGLRKQTIHVNIEQLSPTSTAIVSSTSIHITGEQLSSGVLTDIFGSGIVIKQENIPWFISRASAIAAYLLMYLIIVWGAGMTTSWLYRIFDPTAAWAIHKFLGIAMTVLVFIHGGSLLFDKFIKFGLWDVLIPFGSRFKPLYVGFGIIGFYVILAIMISSMFFKNKSERVWHFIHYSSYPLFVAILIHGIFTGTDTKTSIMQNIYWFTGITFLLIIFYRFVVYLMRPKK